jgi:hypothetical protein
LEEGLTGTGVIIVVVTGIAAFVVLGVKVGGDEWGRDGGRTSAGERRG